MGSNVNYTVVGLFVVLFTVGILGFAYWLAKYGGQQEYDLYQVLMTESVAGLSTDATVKYRGVDVGTVVKMELSPDDPEQVRLLLKIRRGTPVKTDTTATLKFYGVTGLAFIELQGDSRWAPLLKPGPDEIPTIGTKPSAITRVDEALTDLALKSSDALERIARLLSDDNLNNFSSLLQDTHHMVHGVRKAAEGISTQMESIRELVHKGIEMEEEVSKAFVDVTRASLNVEEMAEALRRTYVALGEEANLLVEQGSDMAQLLFADLQVLLEELQVTIEELRTNPADLFLSRRETRPGPGEETAE
ncbi:MAG TPA: MCE family protein [Chromatiaceae bacterium]|nr:MCE family protein [Chromatiaceae bacterium]